MNIQPTITADALCEYLVSPPARRGMLLERAKYPALGSDPFTAARSLIVGFLLDQDAAALRARAETTGRGFAAALAFCESWARVPCPFNVEPSPPIAIGVGPVLVASAAPDVLLTGTIGGQPLHGGLAMYFGPATERVAQTRNALMMRALQGADVESLATVVFSTVRPTPVHGFAPIVQRDIEAACDEIARMWPTV